MCIYISKRSGLALILFLSFLLITSTFTGAVEVEESVGEEIEEDQAPSKRSSSTPSSLPDFEETWWIASDPHIGRDDDALLNLEKAVEDVNDLGISQRGIVLGDLVEDDADHVEDYEDAMNGLDHTWIDVLGNHDFDRYGTEERVRPRTFFSETVGGVRFIYLSDDGMWNDGDVKEGYQTETNLMQDQNDWFKAQLENDPHKPTILMSHQGLRRMYEVDHDDGPCFWDTSRRGWLQENWGNYNIPMWIRGHRHAWALEEDYQGHGFVDISPGCIVSRNDGIFMTIEREDGTTTLTFEFRDHEDGSWIPVEGYYEYEYEITTAIHDWHDLDDTRDDLDENYILMNDIDEDTPGYSDHGEDWDPIGSFDDSPFTGSLNGRGHSISGLNIDAESDSYGGLFAYMDGAFISDLGLINADITGYHHQGVLAGRADDSHISRCHAEGTIVSHGTVNVGGLIGSARVGDMLIEKCFADVDVTVDIHDGDRRNTGGLVGYLTDEATITDSYARGDVHGGRRVGGLVGLATSGDGSSSWIYDSYSTGSVSGTGIPGEDDEIGGFTGRSYTAEVHDCFWDTETSGQSWSWDGTGKTTSEMKEETTFTDAGWDFTGIWGIDPTVNDGYPLLQRFQLPVHEIHDWHELDDVRDDLNHGYILMNDLDEDTSGYSEYNWGSGWDPIGSFDDSPFTGYFDGNGYSISDLTIDRDENDYGGLFAYMDGAFISDLGLINADITGYHHQGVLAGRADDSHIMRCHAEGTIVSHGTVNVGGLIGSARVGDMLIEQCFADVDVTVDIHDGDRRNTGGLVGYLTDEATITDSYARGDVHGGRRVGGLVGLATSGDGSSSWIYDSYSTGSVSGDGDEIGGFTGRSYTAEVYDCFWDTETSGQSESWDGTGKTTSEMKEEATFMHAGWNFGIWRIDPSVNDGYPFFQAHEDPTEAELVLQGWEVSPEVINPGETVTISGEVKNVGDEAGSDHVNLYVDDMDSHVDYEHVNLAPGEDTDVTFTYDDTAEVGTYEVLTDLEEHPDEWYGQFEVEEEEEAELVLQDWSVEPEVVKVGETVTISGEVKNVGDEAGSDDVELYIDDHFIDHKSVSVDPGESTPVTFHHSENETGTYEVRVEFYQRFDDHWESEFIVEEDMVSLTMYSSNGGTTEPEPGEHTYEREEEAEVKAYPDDDWEFSHWMGDYPEGEQEEEEITLVMDEDKSLTAYFQSIGEEEYDLTIDVEGEGSTEPEEGTHAYNEGETVPLEAHPEEGWKFVGWTGDHESEEAETTIEMDSDKSVEAHFEEVEYELTIEVVGEGTTDPAPGTHNYTEGEEVPVEAISDDGWYFEGWSGDHHGTEKEITVMMDDDKTLIANFHELEEDERVLTIYVEGEGTTEPGRGVHVYQEGSEVTVTTTPADGWGFSHWEGDVQEEEDDEITIFMDEDKEITAHFLMEALFEVEVVEYDDEVIEGEELTVDHTVTNTGELEGTQDVVFTVYDGEGNVVYEDLEEGISIDAGGTHQGSFIWESEEACEYDAVIETDDHFEEVTVSVLEEPIFDVSIIEYDDEVVQGEEVVVIYRVVNTGDTENTQTIEFAVDGTVEDSEEVTLEGKEEYEDQFIWETEEAGTGEYTLSVESEQERDEVIVTVSYISYLQIEIIEVDEEVSEGEEVVLEYAVSDIEGYDNAGAMFVEFVVYDEDGEIEFEDRQVIPPGAEDTYYGEFTWETEEEGEYRLEVETLYDHDEVAVTVVDEDLEEEPGVSVWWWILVIIMIAVALIVVLLAVSRGSKRDEYPKNDEGSY